MSATYEANAWDRICSFGSLSQKMKQILSHFCINVTEISGNLDKCLQNFSLRKHNAMKNPENSCFHV